jgi:hypothetical protein
VLRHDLAAYAGGLALGSLVLVVFGFVDGLASTFRQIDLAGFWAGPRALLDGVDPYDVSQWQPAVARLGTQRTADLVYGYPPWMLVALVPLALFPLGLVTLVWTVVGITLAVVGIWVLLRTVVPGWPLFYGLVGATLLASQPAIVTFYSGQWTFLLLGALAFLIALWLNGRELHAALLAAAFVVKPHLFVFAALGLARAAHATGRDRALAVAAVAAVTPVGVVVLARPDWSVIWVREIAAGRAVEDPRAATLPAALGDLLGPVGLGLGVVLLLVAIALAWRFDPRGEAALALWIAISLTAAVYIWSYDHLLLLIPLIIAAGITREGSKTRSRTIAFIGIALLLVAEIALYQLAPGRGDQDLNAFVPALTTALLLVGLWPLRSRSSTRRDAPSHG